MSKDIVTTYEQNENDFDTYMFKTCHRRATALQLLIADSLVAIITIGLFILSATYVVPKLSSFQSDVFDFYQNIKLGKYHFDCTFGGSAIQIAECQIYNGVNVAMFYLLTNLLEYTSMIFRSSNIIETFGRSAGLYYMVRLTVLQIPIAASLRTIHWSLFYLRQLILFMMVHD